MNRAIRTPLTGHHLASSLSPTTAAALFHSTPVLDRRRRSQWNTASSPFRCSSKGFNNYSKRFRRMEAKQTLLRNVSMYAEYLFQSWKCDDDQNTSNNSSWYKKQYSAKAANKNGFGSQESQWDIYRKRKGRFQFCCSDDEEVETIFQSAFRGNRGFYWSFSGEESFHWGYSFGYDNKTDSSNRQYKSYYSEDDTSTVADLASERLALGLSTSGPLKLEEVKKAYRACALRWHPDRHQGSSKVEAEEKFKNCTAAYESLCQNLAVD